MAGKPVDVNDEEWRGVITHQPGTGWVWVQGC